MPNRKTLQRAERDKREGKAASTQAGEFIREEIPHIRHGKRGPRPPQQALAIGLSKARRAGIEVNPPARGKTSEATRQTAEHDYARGHGQAAARGASPRRRAATKHGLEREPHASASHRALGVHARAAAARRGEAQRPASAKHAARTKGRAERSAAAKKVARTRAARRRG